MRCLYHWIAKGHAAVLSFPEKCNPINKTLFNATDADKKALFTLYSQGLVNFYSPPDCDNIAW